MARPGQCNGKLLGPQVGSARSSQDGNTETLGTPPGSAKNAPFEPLARQPGVPGFGALIPRTNARIMTRVEIERDDIVIHLGVIDAVLDLQRELRIPLSHIAGVYDAHEELRDHPVLQMPGIWAPGTIIAGRFIGRGWRALWAVRDIAKAIAIYLRNEDYDKVVIEVQDPATTTRLILRAAAMPR